MAPRVEVQAAASRGPMWRRESQPLGTKLKPKSFSFWRLQTSYTTPYYYSKYKIWAIETKLVNNPLKHNDL